MTTTQPRLVAPGQADRARTVPDATIARLPGYLHALTAVGEQGGRTVSSGELAEIAGVNPAQLRKDLSHLGSYGTRGVGYDVALLTSEVSRQLGLTQQWPVIIVGLGNLGRALANYDGFASRGFPVVALVDAAPGQVGLTIAGLRTESITELHAVVARTGASIGVVATPAGAAQEVCDQLVAAGVCSILNFAATALTAPETVTVRRVDVGLEMQILAYHEQRKTAASALAAGGPAYQYSKGNS